MAVDTSTQRALAGLGYLLMMSAHDGTTTATPFVAAPPPEEPIPDEPLSTDVDSSETAIVFVDLDDQADAIQLHDPNAVDEPDNEEPAAATPEPAVVYGGSGNDSTPVWEPEQPSEPVRRAPEREPEPAWKPETAAQPGSPAEHLHERIPEYVDEFSHHPAAAAVTPEPEPVTAGAARPSAPDRAPAKTIEYQSGGYRGGKSGSLLSELDFLE